MNSNKGVETDPEKIKNDIRTNLATLFERPDWASMAGSMQFELTRG